MGRKPKVNETTTWAGRQRVPGRPRLPEAVTRPALSAVARGARVEDAAAAAGIGASTLRRRIREHGVVMLRERKARPGALSLAEREEIRVGIRYFSRNIVISPRNNQSPYSHRDPLGKPKIYIPGARLDSWRQGYDNGL